MGTLQSSAAPPTIPRGVGGVRPTDTYGLVLVLILLDYTALSTVNDTGWGRLLLVLLLGLTLWYTLRVSQARRIWQVLTLIYLATSTLSALISLFAPGADVFSQALTIVGGLLLIVTPFVILRRIASDPVVTTETVLGTVCVYLLLGFCFAFIYTAIGFLSPTPFFQSQSTATANDYLFFSYTTLTTVGYGNLVPAGNLGQTGAMLEALFGQIYLVIVVARLVSLWGQARPPTDLRHPRSANAQGSDGASSQTTVGPDATPRAVDREAGPDRSS
jgi:hypothetical protein